MINRVTAFFLLLMFGLQAVAVDEKPTVKQCTVSQDLESLQQKVSCMGVGISGCAIAAVTAAAFVGRELWDRGKNKAYLETQIKLMESHEQQERIIRQNLASEQRALDRAIAEKKDYLSSDKLKRTDLSPTDEQNLRSLDRTIQDRTKRVAELTRELDKHIAPSPYQDAGTAVNRQLLEIERRSETIRRLSREVTIGELELEEMRLSHAKDPAALKRFEEQLNLKKESLQIEKTVRRENMNIFFRQRFARRAVGGSLASAAGAGIGEVANRRIFASQCARDFGGYKPEIDPYVDVASNCAISVPIGKAFAFIALDEDEQAKLLNDNPEMCLAYKDLIATLDKELNRSFEAKSAVCAEDGTYYEARVIDAGIIHNHRFEVNRATGAVMIHGSFLPNGNPQDLRYGFEVFLDERGELGSINTKNNNLQSLDRGEQNADFIKREYLTARATAPRIDDKDEITRITPLMDRRLLADMGEQLLSIQRYFPKLRQICEKTYVAGQKTPGAQSATAPALKSN